MGVLATGSAYACTPGLEVSGSKKTDVASPNIGQAKPGLDRSKTWRTAES
jgi:hypothetical protein